MKKSVLYLGMQVTAMPKTGGEYGQLRNREMLEDIFEHVHIIEIPRVKLWVHAKNLLTGKSYGYTSKLKKEIDRRLSNSQYDFVFVDGSMYGGYTKYFHDKGNKTVVFFHNVEYDYYKAKKVSNNTLMNNFLVYYAHRQEMLSIKYATRIITLNRRDNIGLQNYYSRSADMELPIFYNKIPKEELQNSLKTKEEFLLFVGADLCSNNEGIRWFVENVSHYINKKVYIAGGCCEYVKRNIEMHKYPNVQLLGFVDDLDSIYKRASGVICPIFSGSGMKTKTIEALKFGKPVFGTNEAFEGIYADFNKVGGLCNTIKEFISTINNSKHPCFNDYSYYFFIENFSKENIYPKFAKFVESV